MSKLNVLILIFLLGSGDCKKKDGKKKAEPEKYNALPNICENENRESDIVCNCDHNEFNTAQEATCWIIPMVDESSRSSWSHFSSQPILKSLKFNVRPGGFINAIPTQIFQYLRHLEILEIQYATITDLTAYSFANTSHLRELVLSRNSIKVLHPNAFAYLQSLESVNLDENIIMELQHSVFHHVPNLRRLFLSRNNLTIVHDNAFRFLNHLHELELNSNAISIITRETFNGLFRLRRLDLTHNRLVMIGDYTFAEMPELEELELDQNSLEYLSANAFAMLKQLKRLRIAENKLKVLNDALFENCRNVQFLDVRDNELEVLDFKTIEPLWENFKNHSSHLLLEGNKFLCDCHLSWVYSLLNETTNKQVIDSLKELTCIGNEDLTEEPPVSSEQNDQFDSNGLEYDDDDVEYEELSEETGPPRFLLLKIPKESLPCPETLQAQTEVPSKVEDSSQPLSPSTASHLCFVNVLLVVSFLKTAFFT